jgi:phosphohistidine phosphatase SixA
MDTGRILIMRHAEKNFDDPLDPDLTSEGRLRAQELAAYIPDKFGQPDFLFATARSKHSNRPHQTLKPLSKAIDVPIDNTFADQDYSALAYKLTFKPKFDGKLVVVCWHHGNIPPLAHALKATRGDYPDPWGRLVFNLILQFDFKRGTPRVTKIVEPF